MFNNLKMLPPDPVFGLSEQFAKDERSDKVNLTIGIYKNNDGVTPIFEAVHKAEELLLKDERSKSYLSIEGDPLYRKLSQQLIFGENSNLVLNKKVQSIQTPGGTGAIKVFSDFIFERFPSSTIWISNPTWGNHLSIFKNSGLKTNYYRYFDKSNQSLDFEGFKNDLKQSKPNDVVVLHACCHNPSGVDLNLNQWEELADICCKKELIPLFDMAYQGFGDNLESDTIGIKIFEKKLNTFFLANSFSKNFGLYNERIGALHIISHNKDMSETILTNIQPIVRSNYSNPPFHGAGIVTEILSDNVLKNLWMNELNSMRKRIHNMRTLLSEHLSRKQSKVDFNHIINQKGMFSIIDLDEKQVTRLKDEFGVYLLKSGRINIAGLNDTNIKYVADSINSVL